MSEPVPASCWTGCDPLPQAGVPLGPKTTWGIGGPAEWYAEPDNPAALASLLARAERHRVRVRLLGGGSNLLITDSSLPGLTLRPRGGEFCAVDLDRRQGLVRLGAGVPLAAALRQTEEAGLAGLEYFAGIPGTLGGAVRMNAGVRAHSLGLLVEEVGAVDRAGRFNRFTRRNLFFGYRYSSLRGLAITDVTLRLRPDDPHAIRRRRERVQADRRLRQPHTARTAGCTFKNPPGDYAGRLIEEVGCKGLRQGDAQVSHQHANFLVNTGAATCRDMLRLIEIVRCAVEARFGLTLELEIRLWL